MAPNPVFSPISDAWYPFLSLLLLVVGLASTASFFIYEATISRRSRSITKEITLGGLSSIFLGFGSLFLLLASGVYV